MVVVVVVIVVAVSLVVVIASGSCAKRSLAERSAVTGTGMENATYLLPHSQGGEEIASD